VDPVVQEVLYQDNLAPDAEFVDVADSGFDGLVRCASGALFERHGLGAALFLDWGRGIDVVSHLASCCWRWRS
jgi:hypothetical protein